MCWGVYVAGETLRERVVQVYLSGPEHLEDSNAINMQKEDCGRCKV